MSRAAGPSRFFPFRASRDAWRCDRGGGEVEREGVNRRANWGNRKLPCMAATLWNYCDFQTICGQLHDHQLLEEGRGWLLTRHPGRCSLAMAVMGAVSGHSSLLKSLFLCSDHLQLNALFPTFPTSPLMQENEGICLLDKSGDSRRCLDSPNTTHSVAMVTE